jgi:hypothetical protein
VFAGFLQSACLEADKTEVVAYFCFERVGIELTRLPQGLLEQKFGIGKVSVGKSLHSGTVEMGDTAGGAHGVSPFAVS